MPRVYRTGLLIALLAVTAGTTGCAHLVMLHDPLSASEHNDLGVAYESGGKLDLAAKEYRKALRLDSGLTLARVNLGNIEAANERWGRAERQYRRALRDSTTYYDAMNNLAFVLLKQGRRLDEAQALAERAVASGSGRDSLYRVTLEEVKSAPR
jgi:Flp pilus assembly protein TadD